MVAMHYILAYLASPTALEKLPKGRQTVEAIMALGCLVVLLFSLIFLFYTYSFLNRRRAREFGLYNVLGMGRRNISRIVLWESAITTAIALIGGLALGAALSKLAELGMINLMNGEIDYRIQLDFKAVFRTVVCYVPVFVINALAAVIRTRRSSAVNLLKAENAGEKPPRSNWLLAILGVVILGVAYWMAVSIRNPLDALMWFFAAVLLVFMLPLAFAGMHLAFAFPMIRKMLLLFGLTDIGLFIRTTLISFAVFAAFYWIVYRITSGVYYRIISGKEDLQAG